jgi:glycosyl transferase family 25
MRSLLINLDRSPERLAWMTGQFGQYGLPFERVAAVDGRNLLPTDVERLALGQKESATLNASEMACFLSHIACWKRIADGRAPYGAVFEDDLILDPEVAQLLVTDSWIPAGMDLIKLEAATTKEHQSQLGSPRPHRIQRCGDVWFGSGAYVISRAIATRLAALDHLAGPVDLVLFDNAMSDRQCIAYEIRPGICLQACRIPGYSGDLASVIDPERTLVCPSQPPCKPKAPLPLRVAREVMRPAKRLVRRCRLRYERMRAPALLFTDKADRALPSDAAP